MKPKSKTYYKKRPLDVEVVEAPGGALAYFRENIKRIDAFGEESGYAYEADEYSTFLQGSYEIAVERVNANPELFKLRAKEEEAKREAEEEAAAAEPTEMLLLEMAADHEERICMIEMMTGEV